MEYRQNYNASRLCAKVNTKSQARTSATDQVIRGTDHEGSDLDILVDAMPGATLFDLGGLQIELEELLGIPVDVLTPGDLPPKLRRKIVAEARPV